ncbi:FkbM family methyltransferase [Paenibacillus sp. 481]|uniref:FkbM family methyltransferase n=1 Tax=Paenibacillus sp. 481 TaxID=2835869 RepID=UPI001E4F4A7B|nr:FkbM family methyltransferase [Paenibacillus sp. 481]UHA71655.1 FkbM family methyltransferase [Paenibacillus sp. 481]
MSLKYTSVEHEVIFNKLMEGLQRTEDINQSIPFQNNSIEKNKYMEEIHTHINVMSNTRENRAHRYIHSHRKVLGPFIVFGKKVVRKFLKWYLDPVANQQTEFNNAVTPAIGRTTELLNSVLDKQSEMEQAHSNRIEQLQSEHKEALEKAQVQQLQSEQSIQNLEQEQYGYKLQIESLNQHIDSLNRHTDSLIQQIESTNQFVNSMSKINEIYAKQVDEINNKLNKLNDIAQIDNNDQSFFLKTTYSQSGEDSILAYLIMVLGIPLEEVSYIDLGANHAKEMSNTYHFYKSGAKGVLVEANPQLIPELKFYRHKDIILNNCVDVHSGHYVDFYILNGDGLSTPDIDTANQFCQMNSTLKIIDKQSIKTITYDDIVSIYLGKAPTILSIDIEGKDMEIIHSINWEDNRPLIIVAEMIEYSIELAYHTKNEALKEYLNSKDYDEYAFTGINSIYLDKRYLKERAVKK